MVRKYLLRDIHAKVVIRWGDARLQGRARVWVRRDGMSRVVFSPLNDSRQGSVEMHNALWSRRKETFSIKSYDVGKPNWPSFDGQLADRRQINATDVYLGHLRCGTRGLTLEGSICGDLRIGTHPTAGSRGRTVVGITNCPPFPLLPSGTLVLDGSDMLLHRDPLAAELEELLTRKELPAAITGWLEFPAQTLCRVRAIAEVACLMMSFACGNRVVPLVFRVTESGQNTDPVYEEYDFRKGVGSWRIPTSVFDSPMAFEGFLQGCFRSFRNCRKPLSLDAFITYYLAARPQPLVLNAATRMLALIQLCERVLTAKRMIRAEEEVKFLQLFAKLDGVLHVLSRPERKKLVDELRDVVRNPLSHRGVFCTGDHDKQFIVYKILSALCQRVFLRAVGYRGRFVDEMKEVHDWT